MKSLKVLDSCDQWKSTMYVVKQLLTENNDTRLSNIMDWLKLDMNTVGFQLNGRIRDRRSWI